MNTLKQFSFGPETIPAVTAWYIADLSEAKGRQSLFMKQAPQKLKALREHAMIESAVSSNRIEGIAVEPGRIPAIIAAGKPLLDRNEEEVRGYRNALKWIHERYAEISVSEDSIRKLHSLIRGDIWDAGLYKERDGDIIEKYPDGRTRIRFKPVTASQTPLSMSQMIELWRRCIREKWIHPLIGVAAFNLDFLCIHPFRDGNGRVSRLLLLLQSLQMDFLAGHFISIERHIEQTKDRYYETLEHSSYGWHEAKHDPWPYIHYLLSVFKSVYREFEERIENVNSPGGSKTLRVKGAVTDFRGTFTLKDIEKACVGVSKDMIRRVLKKLKEQGTVECLGRGPGALWRKRAIPLKEGNNKGNTHTATPGQPL